MRTRVSIVTASLLLIFTSLFGASGLAQTKSTVEEPRPLPPGLDERFLDTSTDPCVNFFKNACGNFAKYYPIPNNRSRYTPAPVLYTHNKSILHTMLEKAAAGGSERTANQQKIGDFYAACMNADAISQKGLKPFHPELDRIAALKDKKELSSLLGHLQLINVGAFLGIGEQQDYQDA